MNIKRIFGGLLTLLGICGLIYAAVLTINSGGSSNVKQIITYAIVGLIFFIPGISLVRNTKDEA